jgi:ABC-type transport system involved in multi-copper enzyme maturation permease subunit
MKVILLRIIGILCIVNGVANIIDDARILPDDITSILAGVGFLIVSTFTPKKDKAAEHKLGENHPVSD